MAPYKAIGARGERALGMETPRRYGRRDGRGTRGARLGGGYEAGRVGFARSLTDDGFVQLRAATIGKPKCEDSVLQVRGGKLDI
jgi:hypothetical protein